MLVGHTDDVDAWVRGRDLVVSEQMSNVMLLTPHTRQIWDHPVVVLNGAVLPVQPNPKIQGFMFDPALHFYKHVENIKKIKPD